MEKGKRMEQNKQPKWKFVRNIIITLIALGLVAGVFLVAPDYILKDKYEGTRLIINNKDVTASGRVKNELIIEDDVIYQISFINTYIMIINMDSLSQQKEIK